MSEFSDDLAELERAIKEQAKGRYVLKLYVTGFSARAATAISNVRSICEHYLANRYDLEVIDVLLHPQIALDVQLLAAPTLIKEQPAPVRRVVGDMSNEDRILYSLDIVKDEP